MIPKMKGQSMPTDIVIAGPVRTAIGSFNGAFAEVPATVLGSAVIKAAIAPYPGPDSSAAIR